MKHKPRKSLQDVAEAGNAREETFSHLTTVTKGLLCSSARSEGKQFLVFVGFLTCPLNWRISRKDEVIRKEVGVAFQAIVVQRSVFEFLCFMIKQWSNSRPLTIIH